MKSLSKCLSTCVLGSKLYAHFYNHFLALHTKVIGRSLSALPGQTLTSHSDLIVMYGAGIKITNIRLSDEPDDVFAFQTKDTVLMGW